MHKLQYNWNEIQKYYDQGHSIRECHKKFGFGNTARIKATKAGRFVPRSHSDACILKRTIVNSEDKNSFSQTSLLGEIACSKVDCTG